MTTFRTLARAGAVLATAALLVPSGPAAAAIAKAKDPIDSVLIRVDSVSPSTPTPTTEHSALTIVLTVTNTTSSEIDDFRVLAERGDPIGNQNALDASIANPVPPTSGLPIPATTPAVDHLTLDAGDSTTVVFSTTTSVVNDGKGLCICANATQSWIYPLFFTAHQVQDGVDNLLGLTSTYLPIFYQKPQPVRVSWIWPLLEPPHRFIGDTQFTDDSLAASVSSGRLSRALAVVEEVGPQVPITLLIDPELLDELEVMSTEQYTVLDRDGKTTTPGAGQAAATEWLDRLRNVLQNDPLVSVRLTPYADPDVETLTERQLPWSTFMPAEMLDRVTNALAGRSLDSSLAWPVTGAIGKPTLHELAHRGVNTFVLDSSAVRTQVPSNAVSPGQVRLQAKTQVAAVLLSPTIEKYAAKALSANGDGAGAIPPLVSELAVRATQEPDVQHAVTIAAPRYVDPDVTSAVRTIDETTHSLFARPIALSAAVAQSTLFPTTTHTATLGKVPASVTATVPGTMQAASTARDGLKLVRSLLDTANDPDAAALVAALPGAIQRAESSAWRNPANVKEATRFAGLLNDEFGDFQHGVQFLGPSSGSYTLASNTGPLPITISNKLPYAVRVRVIIRALQTSGFSAKPVRVQTIEANSTKTVYVTATAERSGIIKIAVLLKAPNHQPVGVPIQMQVRSTALGFIGVIIMIVAGSVLGIALLWRIVRRMRNRQQPGGPPVDPVRVATPEPVR